MTNTLTRSIVVLTFCIVAFACKPGKGSSDSSGAGAYWCVVGTTQANLAGRCTATQDTCMAHVTASEPRTVARCEQTSTTAYELHWSTTYGPSEAWYIDAATCDRARLAFQSPPPPCTAARWDETGMRAH